MRIYLFFIISLFISCKKFSSNAEETQSFYKEQKNVQKIKPDDIETITQEEAKTLHKDKKFDYEYRTGTSKNYEYNYDIVGTNEDGNQITGSIIIKGKSGAGKIEDDKGNEYEIEVEWYDYGKLKGVDENGITFELTVE
ncbi:hypothetical protein [Flavobacterium sp.]|uniref:hypothetical protein n=1 Tax=Flavobacterium sp. TaxID=239 RepID=UPI00286C49D8|nr:hypothetical protein [Flavobacterium sp.]